MIFQYSATRGPNGIWQINKTDRYGRFHMSPASFINKDDAHAYISKLAQNNDNPRIRNSLQTGE